MIKPIADYEGDYVKIHNRMILPPYCFSFELKIFRQREYFSNFAKTLEGDAENLTCATNEPITCSPRTR
jgi:hypothetical protein